jgi:hypothetical protein
MPPFVPLPDGVQVEIVGLLLGKTVENRFWVKTRFTPLDSSELQPLADAVSGWYIAQLLPHLSDDLQHVRVIASDWTDTPAPAVAFNVTGGFGGVAGGSLSANVSVRVAFKGTNDQDFRNNSHFIPGIPRSAVVGNYYTSAFRSAVFNAYVNLTDLIRNIGTEHNLQWVITSRVEDKAYRTEQAWSRTDFILFPSPVVSPRRRRLP